VTDLREKTSAGGVVVRRDGALKVCLIKPVGRTVWGLPKGGIEPGETLEQAALREVLEETGILGEIDQKLGSIDYVFYSRGRTGRVHKTVHYYLMRALSGDTERHDHEVSEARWVSIPEALRLMTYPNERDMVVRAATALGEATEA
jgi:8-oxo-dGTP pyrophosphatase MutT (NUDIX family)